MISLREPVTAPTNSEWRIQAACRNLDPDIFFPPQGTSSRTLAEARKYCRECPVSTQCLSYALVYRENHGIWGGLTEKERKRLRSQLRKKGLLKYKRARIRNLVLERS